MLSRLGSLSGRGGSGPNLEGARVAWEVWVPAELTRVAPSCHAAIMAWPNDLSAALYTVEEEERQCSPAGRGDSPHKAAGLNGVGRRF